MFDTNELVQLEQVVEKVVNKAIDDRVPPIVERIINDKVPSIVRVILREEVPGIVRPIINEEISSAMEHQIMPQFDLLHGRIDSFENRFDSLDARVDRMDRKITTQVASKGWVEDRLDGFRTDLGLKYRTA